MLYFKIDVLQALKEKGYNTTVIRKSRVIGQKTLYEIKAGKVPGEKIINILSAMLNLQPGSFIGFKMDADTLETLEKAKQAMNK